MARTSTRQAAPGAKRGYRQFCGLARALDLVGERWTLLIVRELSLGARRFTDLHTALPGISTNLLATRLRGMERAGILRRDRLPPPAASNVYALTDWGSDLSDVVKRLGLWGLRLLDHPRPDDTFHPGWLAFYFELTADRDAARGVHDVYEFDVDGDRFHVIVDDGAITVRQGPAPWRPDMRAQCSLDTFARIGSGQLSPSDAAGDGLLLLEGTPETLARSQAILAPAAPSPAGVSGYRP